jgi:hypothetical protein
MDTVKIFLISLVLGIYTCAVTGWYMLVIRKKMTSDIGKMGAYFLFLAMAVMAPLWIWTVVIGSIGNVSISTRWMSFTGLVLWVLSLAATTLFVKRHAIER